MEPRKSPFGPGWFCSAETEEGNMNLRFATHVVGLFIFLLLFELSGAAVAEEQKEVYTIDQSVKEALANNP